MWINAVVESWNTLHVLKDLNAQSCWFTLSFSSSLSAWVATNFVCGCLDPRSTRVAGASRLRYIMILASLLILYNLLLTSVLPLHLYFIFANLSLVKTSITKLTPYAAFFIRNFTGRPKQRVLQNSLHYVCCVLQFPNNWTTKQTSTIIEQ